MPPRSLSAETREAIRQRFIETGSITEAARVGGVTRNTARTYCTDLRDRVPTPPDVRKSRTPVPPPRLPDPAPEAGGPGIPDPEPLTYEPFVIDTPGTSGVISDVHLPYHDKTTIERWLDDCERMGARALLFNGDLFDFYQLSSFVRDPSAPRMKAEIEKGRQLLAYVRSRFPRARVVVKEGNHDERLRNYLATRAPELFDLPELHLPSLVGADKLGIEWVADKRVVMLGKLPVIHGHEYRGGGGVMPARWLYLRTGESAMVGHFHQPTTYTFRTVTGKEVGMWSLGCACFLSPLYAPLNQWSHGWGMVEVAQDRTYHVHNRRLLKNGQVV
jgi:predicted phosphodiesterase